MVINEFDNIVKISVMNVIYNNETILGCKVVVGIQCYFNAKKCSIIEHYNVKKCHPVRGSTCTCEWAYSKAL